MTELSATQRRPGPVVRWIARGWSVASVGLVLAFIIGEGLHPGRMTAMEVLGFLFFPLGICVGMILAWWREGLGGGITVASLLAFYALHFATAGAFPKGLAWVVFAAPGFLFVLSWYLSRRSASSTP